MIITWTTQDTGLQTFYGTGPYALVWAGSRSTLRKIIVGVHKRLNNYVIFTIYTLFINVIAGHKIQPGRPRVGDP